ncbi:replication initiation protein [Persephonella sp.]|uniref:replication initiation protein n=1 Tax=Persephonella sp. TaxID=2060922 RepID=UPI00263700FC|nr:replication initiation protein [Persephonella sp.]
MKEKDKIIEPEICEVSPNMKLQKHNAVMENALIEARYSLTVEEQRLVLTTIAMLDNVETAPSGFPMLKIPKKLIIEATGIHEKNYHQIKTALRRLMQRVIEIETIGKNGKREFVLYQWFAKAKYNEGAEHIEVQFHPDLKPYLLELKKRFTKIPLKQVLQLRSKYAIRLYELLKRYEDTGFRTDYLPELRRKLGIEEKEYSRFFDFERYVLKPAVKEINEKTDLEVSYTKKRTGRRITHIEFEFHSKNANKGDTTQTEKSPSEGIDIQALKQPDLWDTTLRVLENVYKADTSDIDSLRAFTYAVYKTDVYPKQIIIKSELTGKANKELLKILLHYWSAIKEIIKTETQGNYEAKISKELTGDV